MTGVVLWRLGDGLHGVKVSLVGNGLARPCVVPYLIHVAHVGLIGNFDEAPDTLHGQSFYTSWPCKMTEERRLA